jgi:predicted aminopeptidase
VKRVLRMAIFASGGLAATVVAATAAVCLTSGCGTVRYYAQAAAGHLEIVNAARPVAEWLADPATPPAVKQRLELSQRIRDFAVHELGQPDNASYRRYADLNRAAAVWNVVAAPELSLTLKTWCFVVVGCVGYRGYYSEAAARAEAESLRDAGLESLVYPVPAYSTLGRLPGAWLADPLLNTFLHYPEPDLARLVFHELAHQVVYVPGDTSFNESFATAVEQIGSARWLAAHGSDAMRKEQASTQARRADFRALTRRYRGELQALYASGLSDAEKRERKASLFAAMRAEHEAMKAERWGGYVGYDRWFARANNAALGVLAAYNDLVPQFEALFRREGSDFARFYAEARRLAALPPGPRRAHLAAAAASSPTP